MSVVIPTYNRETVLPRAIESALDQSYENIEVIVVDDGSDDATGSMIDEQFHGDIEYIRHERNKGGSSARNTGIEAANGEYIAFLDSDDRWYANKIELQVEKLESLPEDWVAVYCDFHQTRPSQVVEFLDNMLPRSTGYEGGEELLEHVLTKRFAHGGSSSLVVESSAVEEIDGFDERFPRHQDIEFLVRLLQVGKLAYVDEELYHKNDTGIPDFEDVVRSDRLFRAKFEELIDQHEREGNEIRRIHNFRLAKCYFRNRLYLEGFKYLTSATFPETRDVGAVVVSVIQGVIGKDRW